MEGFKHPHEYDETVVSSNFVIVIFKKRIDLILGFEKKNLGQCQPYFEVKTHHGQITVV